MVPKPQTKSTGERLCAAYLRQRGWSTEYEKLVGSPKHDFTAHYSTGDFIMEVYEPEETVEASRAFVRDPAAMPSKLFKKPNKQRQIAAAHSGGLPFVGVLVATNCLDIAAIDIAIAMMGINGYIGSTSFNAVSGIAVVERFNPTAWKIPAAVDERLGSRADGARMGGAVVILEASRDLAASGAHDPMYSVARLSILLDPFSDNPLDTSLFPGPHDEIWERTGKAGPEWFGKVAEGRLIHEVSSA